MLNGAYTHGEMCYSWCSNSAYARVVVQHGQFHGLSSPVIQLLINVPIMLSTVHIANPIPTNKQANNSYLLWNGLLVELLGGIHVVTSHTPR